MAAWRGGAADGRIRHGRGQGTRVAMAPASQDLHIGFLCDYGSPLLPQSGIGVFVYNLIDGLLACEPGVRITLLVTPGGQDALGPLARRWGPRVRIRSAARSSFLWTACLRRLMLACRAARDRLRHWRER